MKFLKDEHFAALKQKSDNFDSIVNSILGKNPEMKAEDVTAEMVIDALNAESGDNSDETLSALKTEISNLKNQVGSITKERDDLQALNDELSELPGVKSLTKKVAKAESSAIETDDVLKFAQQNSGNTLAIAEKLKAEGLV